MQLYYSPPSPYARLARAACRELHPLPHVEEVIAHPFENPPALLTANPLGKVPCLVLDDGAVLIDSEVICRYFDALAGDGRLYGPVDDDWQGRRRRAMLQGMLDVALGARTNKAMPDAAPSAYWAERYREALERAIGRCEDELGALTEPFSILPLHLACVLGYVDFRHPEIAWRERHATLAAWYERFSTRPSLAATTPEEYVPD